MDNMEHNPPLLKSPLLSKCGCFFKQSDLAEKTQCSNNEVLFVIRINHVGIE